MIDFYCRISIYCVVATISSRNKTTKAYVRRCGKIDDERPMIQSSLPRNVGSQSQLEQGQGKGGGGVVEEG
jgi:hypothetical protein